MHLQNKVAFITGGTGGLGNAAARRLAEEGAKVVVTDMDDDAGTSLASDSVASIIVSMSPTRWRGSP